LERILFGGGDDLRVEFVAEKLERVDGVGGELRASFEVRVWAFVGLRARIQRGRLACGFGRRPAAMVGSAIERDTLLTLRRDACAAPFQEPGGLRILRRNRIAH
jgi:hypothetical protein